MRHVPGVDNTQTDALSRNNMTKLFLSLPKADPTPTRVPEDLLGNRDTARLDLYQLESEAARLLYQGLAKSTTKTYSAAQRIFIDFCRRLQLTSLPASEEKLSLFMAELTQTRAHSTIRNYLSAVRHLHIIHGWGNPLKDTLRLDLILRGVQRGNPSVPTHVSHDTSNPAPHQA